VLGAQQCLETNAATIEDARALTKGDANDARRSFKAIHALKMPAQYHVAGSWASSSSLPGALAEGESVDSEKESADLVRYFSGQADEMGKKLEALKKNMGQVEDYVKGLETQIREQGQRIRTGRAGDQGPKTADEKIRELAGVLREFEGGILTVAGSVGGAREQVQEIMLSESRAGRWSRR
jgi:nucleoporin p58/p45